MNERTSLITGSTSGIGQALCVQLLDRGNDLVLVNRSESRTRDQIEALTRQFPDASIRYYHADFAHMAAIREAADRIGKDHGAIHSAYLLAGALSATGHLSNNGIELHFAVNCLAPYLLVRLLQPQFAAGRASVVVAGSSARNMVRKLEPAAMYAAGPGGMKAYAHSKQAVTAAFSGLKAEYATDHISLRVADVAPTKTSMAQSPALPLIFRLARFAFASPQSTAARLIAVGTGAFDGKPRRNLPDSTSQAELLRALESAIARANSGD